MKRHVVMFLISLFLLVAYMVITDPYTDNSLLSDIPYGIALVLLIKVFFLSLTFITMMSYLMDVLVDKSYGIDEKVLVEKANDTPSGAGYVLIARSLIFLSGAIIILGVLLYNRGS